MAETYTVDDALISMGFGKFQTLVCFYSGIAYAAEAMEVMILSFIGQAVQSEWNLSPQQKSFISSAVFAGMLVGAYTWGVVSDNYGRRTTHKLDESVTSLLLQTKMMKGFLFTALVTSGAGFLSTFSPNYIILLILQFFVGVGLGGGPVLFSWFLEFVPSPNRGFWMVLFSFFWSLGTVLEASLAWAVMPTLGWRWLIAISSLPSFILLIFYNNTLESPRYLCMKGRKFDAVQVLASIARMNNKALPLGELTSDFKGEADDLDENTSNFQGTQAEHMRTNEAPLIRKFMSIGVSYKQLFSRNLIRSTLLLWMAFFGNSFAYYGVILLTSGLSGGDENCSKILLYIKSKEETNLYKDIFITSMAEVPGLILSAVIVDRIGRKLSVASMLFATFAFMIPLVFHQKEVLTTTLLFCARICITGSITTLAIYAPEIYPTSVRSTGYGTANSMGKIGGVSSPLVAVGLVDRCQQAAAVLLFEAVIFVTGLAVVFFPLETKGSKLKDSL